MLTNRSMPPGVIVPVLAYPDVAAAVEWLCDTFGFKERLRIGDHRSQLIFGGASLVVAAGRARQTINHSAGAQEKEPTHSIMVQVADVDAHCEHARQRGARILSPPETFPFGERQYSVEDPFGHHWTFTQPVADVDPAAWGGRLAG
jgi:uncharacterized glyoxalase superfamily protein PhnB